jgi:hypothetical protein
MPISLKIVVGADRDDNRRKNQDEGRQIHQPRVDKVYLCPIGDVINSAGTRNAEAEPKAEMVANA